MGLFLVHCSHVKVDVKRKDILKEFGICNMY